MINLIFYGLVDTYQMNESYVSYRIMINIYIYISHLFVPVLSKGKATREIILRFHPCCHGASFQFLFLCGAVGDSEAFAVCDEFAHEFVYPKSQDHGRNT